MSDYRLGFNAQTGWANAKINFSADYLRALVLEIATQHPDDLELQLYLNKTKNNSNAFLMLMRQIFGKALRLTEQVRREMAEKHNGT